MFSFTVFLPFSLALPAFVKRNDPFDASIPGLVTDGYVVRTRSDADTVEARDNNTGPRDAALASGAQWVSTDHFSPDSKTRVAFEGGKTVRGDPVSAEGKVEIEP